MSELSRYGANWFYTTFANSIDFPYYKGKRVRNKPHMKDAALLANHVTDIDDKTTSFNIGNENAQAVAPQYAILENAPTIHYGHRKSRRIVKNKDGTSDVKAYGKTRSWGTEKSRGSQQYISDKGSRDYTKWSYGSQGNLKQEYRSSSKSKKVTGTSTSYSNKHYHYIERIIESNIEKLASELGGTVMKRVVSDMSMEDIEATNNLDLPSIIK